MKELIFIFVMIGAVVVIAEDLYSDALEISQKKKVGFKHNIIFFIKFIIILGLSIQIYLGLENK